MFISSYKIINNTDNSNKNAHKLHVTSELATRNAMTNATAEERNLEMIDSSIMEKRKAYQDKKVKEKTSLDHVTTNEQNT